MTLGRLRRLRLLVAPMLVGLALTAAMPIVPAPLAQTQPQPRPPTPLPSPLPSPPQRTPEADEGRTVYLRDCAWCHMNDGRGSVYGPSLVAVGAASIDFMLSTGRMPISDPLTRPQRLEPQYPRGMRRKLVEYVSTLSGEGPPVPQVNPAAGSLAEGARLYEEHCAACHSSTGIGGALTNGLIAPDVLHSTAIQVAEAMRIGGAGLRTGHMPQFGPDTIDRRQLDSIARYVLYLQRPAEHGASLGRIGPIAEGFVTWLGILLLLVLLIGWIGTRMRRGNSP